MSRGPCRGRVEARHRAGYGRPVHDVAPSQARWAVVAWAGILLLTSAAGLSILHVAFTAFGDRCYELHESADTPGGWLVIAGSLATAGLLARWLRPPVPVRWVVAGLVVQALVFWWSVNPAGRC